MYSRKNVSHSEVPTAMSIIGDVNLLKKRLAYLKGIEKSPDMTQYIENTRQKVIEQLEEYSDLQQTKHFPKLVVSILRKFQLEENKKKRTNLPVDKKVIPSLLAIDTSKTNIFFVLRFLHIFHIKQSRIEDILTYRLRKNID